MVVLEIVLCNYSKFKVWFTHFIFCCILSISADLNAQNLISNNGFESNIAIPSGYGQWYNCQGWSNVNNYIGFSWPYASPDYLKVGAGGGVGLPNNTFATVNPYAGNSIMGFIGYYAPSTDFREYLAHPLSSPMIPGQPYTVSFYMTNGLSNWYCGAACNHIGVKFSIGPLSQINHEPLNIIPDCEINTKWWSTTWQLVSFTFVPTAAFNYMTLGNFFNDLNTVHAMFGTGADGAYYFVDEMNVTPAVPLPVEWLSFRVENNGNENIIEWSTASELNSDHFSIERSLDGIHFIPIGIVHAAGQSNDESNYIFYDNYNGQYLVYYQLKLVDFNGTETMSKIIAVKPKSIGEPVFYPDPNNTRMVHCLLRDDSHPVVIKVFSTTGSIIQEFSTCKGHFSILLPENGIYFIHFTCSTFNLTKKWITY